MQAPNVYHEGGSKVFAPDASARALMVICAFNEHVKLENTLRRFPPKAERDYDVLIVDDGSTDGSIEKINTDEFLVHRLGRCAGVGAAIRKAIQLAREWNYGIIMFMAGNDKDRPDEIHRILDPVRHSGFALVQGSRYLPGGSYGNMPPNYDPVHPSDAFQPRCPQASVGYDKWFSLYPSGCL
jgi:glycosyltransferase involved in cell wall biosynthesis